jgi:hypothetical protein
MHKYVLVLIKTTKTPLKMSFSCIFSHDKNHNKYTLLKKVYICLYKTTYIMIKLYSYILLITLIFTLTVKAQSQSISIVPRELTKGAINAVDPDGNYNLEVQTRINNNSVDAADSILTWKIITLDQPMPWQLDFCDPAYCRTDAQLNEAFDFKLKKGAYGFMKADFFYNATSGNGLVKVVIFAKNNPANNDTLTINANSWITAVKEVNKTQPISFYPNPVKDLLTIKVPVKTTVTVDIYNILGTRVKTFVHSDVSTTVNLSDLQNGVYFIRFTENGKLYTKQFTKAE